MPCTSPEKSSNCQREGSAPTYTLGINIDSASSKTVILQDGVMLIAHVVELLGTGMVGPERILKEVFGLCGLSQRDISYTMVTGCGRMNCSCANEQINELSHHVKGIHFLLPTIHTVIDIGGQDAKALSITDKGQLTAFQMDDKCAASTERLLDVVVRVLDVEINKLGPLSQKSGHLVSISNICTVLAESEVASRLSSNVPTEDATAGVHSLMAKHVAGMSLRLDRAPDVVMSEGVALSIDVVHAMEQEMGCHILVDPLCQSVGVIGAAVLTWGKRRKGEADDHE